MKKGVLLLALKHAYYGNYAAQLAASIKFTAPDIPIAILHDDVGIRHLTPARKALFSHIIKIDEKLMYCNGRQQTLRAKTYIYDLTPFDTTIFLDADMLWLPRKPITELFDSLQAYDFTMANRGATCITQATDRFINWAKPKDIIEHYGYGMLYNLSSEFIYFRKSKEAEKLFTAAKEAYDTMKVNCMMFAGGIPDEMAFTVAMLQTGIYPHTAPFTPCYWEQFMNKNLAPTIMYKQYYAYSLGGAIQSKRIKTFHDNLANFYCNKMNIGRYFPLQSKRSWLPERVNI